MCTFGVVDTASNMQTIKLVVVGDSFTGKSSLLSSYSMNHVSGKDAPPTVFDNYTKISVIDGVSLTLSMWDTSGIESYDRLRPLSYPQTDVFLVVFSVVHPPSFENVRQIWFPEVNHNMPRTPVILVGNMADRKKDPDILSYLQSLKKGPIEMKDAEALRKEIGASAYVECSAVTREGLDDVFKEAVKAALQPYGEKKRKHNGCKIT